MGRVHMLHAGGPDLILVPYSPPSTEPKHLFYYFITKKIKKSIVLVLVLAEPNEVN